ncbi:MAG TPA: hypothetical protein GYA07_06765 [Verrucomicrobia bacterium]|nr:hypothetical protein [Verrucomicrobiota bacterium]HOB32854.1 hypothetical protein [Verrucomicrobiota bacterium]HOP95886.1 hypothetical protein [Verrucomicrobiota bacterium]
MGLLNFLSKAGAEVLRLPSGSLTVDRQGNIIASTISSSYPSAVLKDVSADVLKLFREARAAQLSLTELHIHFASLQITARELRGGAIIFLTPKTVAS